MAAKYSTVETLRQQYCFVPAKHKDCYLAFVLNELSGSTSMVRAWARDACAGAQSHGTPPPGLGYRGPGPCSARASANRPTGPHLRLRPQIFTRTCDSTRKVALTLRALGFGAVPIHGQMSQPKRLGALNKFKAGERPILVATDVASRGLDIPSVDLVVNYDVPANSKDYIHRVGRTARAGRSGRAVTIVTQ